MLTSGWLYASLFIVASCILSGVLGMGYNFTEKDRRTHIYGRDFIVALPLRGGLPEKGTLLQIACVSSGSSAQATGNVTLIGGNYNYFQSFNAAPIKSFDLDGLIPFLKNKTTAALKIQSDSDIIVTLFIKIGGTLSAYTAMPVTSLDKHYLVASYGLQEDNLSELTVVATSPKRTTVSFDKNAGNVTLVPEGSQSGYPINPVLNRGESSIYETVNDFIGGHLVCSEPASAMVGSRCSSPGDGCAGQSMENLLPLGALGMRYTAVAVNSPGISNTFRAVAVWDDTEITWSSGDLAPGNVTLHNSQTQDLSFTVKEAGTISGSKPFLLLHHIEKGNPVSDIALVSVPPHEQFTRKTITFETYQNNNPEKQRSTNLLTIISPCKSDTLLQRFSLSRPLTFSTNSPVFPVAPYEGAMCKSIRKLEPGVYTLGASPDNVVGAYTAILYTITETGVAAHVLVTELNQVVCSVEEPSQKISLCPTMVPSLPPSVTPQSASGKPVVTPSSSEKNNSGGTILAVVIAVVSLVAGATIISILVFRYCKGRRWRRLEETDYMEDNPIRMQALHNVEQGL